MRLGFTVRDVPQMKTHCIIDYPLHSFIIFFSEFCGLYSTNKRITTTYCYHKSGESRNIPDKEKNEPLRVQLRQALASKQGLAGRKGFG